jgi:hypothetical protein
MSDVAVSGEVRDRFLYDALFHARVTGTEHLLAHEGTRLPVDQIAVILNAQDRVQRHDPSDPLFNDPELHRSLMTLAHDRQVYPFS